MSRSVKSSATRALVIVVLSVLIAEFLLMNLLSLLPASPAWMESIIDSILLVVIVSPLLYFFLFRPFLKESKKLDKTDVKLASAREKAQQYLDVAGVMLLVIDCSGTVELINKKGLDILGFTESEVLGRNWFNDFIPDRYRLEIQDFFHAFCNEWVGQAQYLENSVLTKDGNERTIAWNNILLHNADNEVVGVLGSGEDITDRKIAEEALRRAHHGLEERVEARTRELQEANQSLAQEFAEHKLAVEALEESELRLSSITSTASDAIVAADSNAKIVSWNKGAEAMFGYSPDEALGRSLSLLMPERFRTRHETSFASVVATGSSQILGRTLEFEGLRKDGQSFPLELSIASWKTGRGVFFSGIIRDISERKRIEQEKENIQAQLLHSQKLEAIGRLIVGVAHDFSNIILSVKGYSSTSMKGLDKDDPLYANLEKIQLLLDKGSNITHQLTVFARRQPLVFSEVDVNSTIDGMLNMIDNLIRDDIKVTVKLEPNLWKVRADSGNIDQVLMNLVVNANDVMLDGGELLIKTENVEFDVDSCKRIAEARPGTFVSVSVTDSGAGMDRTVASRIFDPFFTTKGKNGSGLGLSVVYGIVNRHKGWIDVESEPGKGATFTFYLPALSNKEDAKRLVS